MRQVRTPALLVAAALLVAGTAEAQQRMTGSGIRVQKDAGDVALTPGSRTTELVVPSFTMSPYGALNERNMTYIMATNDSLEIEIGNLAATKGTAASVRDYGRTLVNDHTAHLAKTWEIITDEDVGVAAVSNNVLADRARGLLAWLRANPAGPKWDQTFLRFQADLHENLIQVFSANLKNAHDDDLEDHIEKSVASFAKHRDMARSTLTGLGY